MRLTFIIVLCLATLAGLGLAYIDTSHNWNDDGVSVLLVLLASFTACLITTEKPWLIALATGIWIPLFNIVEAHNYGALLALIPAFAGAYIGAALHKLFQNL